MNIPIVVLGDLVDDARTGFASGKHDNDGIAQVRMNNVTTEGNLVWDKVRRVPKPKKLNGLLLQHGDIVFNATNSPELAGKSALFSSFPEPVTYSNHFIRLRVNDSKADPAYVQRYLAQRWQQRTFEKICKRWVNQATVSRESLLSLKIPLPPLSEQKRIAAILDQADALRRLRRQSIDRLNALLRSIFLEIWSKSKQRRSLGELTDEIERWQRPAQRAEQFTYIDIGSVSREAKSVIGAKHLKVADAPSRAQQVLRAGDVLVSNVRPNLNAVALISEEYDGAVASSGFTVLRPKMPNLAWYVFLSTTSRSFVAEMERQATGASYPAVNERIVKNYVINKPDQAEIDRFARTGKKIRETIRTFDAGLAEMDHLFFSLQQRSFREEL